jgi:hypothetical protein
MISLTVTPIPLQLHILLLCRNRKRKLQYSDLDVKGALMDESDRYIFLRAATDLDQLLLSGYPLLYGIS